MRKSSKIAAAFRSRAFRSGSYTLAAAVLAVAAVLLINLFIGALPDNLTHLDTTSSSVYAFAPETLELLNTLEEDVTLYCVVQSGSEDPTVSEFLARYAAKSAHIRVEYVDPVLYPTFTSAYSTAALTEGSVIVESTRRYTIIDYSDMYAYELNYNTYVYDTYLAAESVLTSAIDYVTSQSLPKVYALTGHGELSLDTNFSSAIARQNISVETLSLLTTDAVPEDCQCLLLLSPTADLSEEETDKILQYLGTGGNLLLFTDYTEEAMPNFSRIMEFYGLTRGSGIIIEGDDGHCLSKYPHYLLPDLGDHAITDPLADGGYYVLAPIAEPILLPEEAPREGIEYTTLLQTSDASFLKRLTDYQLSSYAYEDGDESGPFTVGLAVTENLNAGDSLDEEAHTHEEMDDALQTRIVYFSTSYLLDSSLSYYVAGTNEDLILNALDWMTSREGSISVSAKQISLQYLSMSAADSRIGIVMLAAFPFAALITGTIVIVRRKRRKA